MLFAQHRTQNQDHLVRLTEPTDEECLLKTEIAVAHKRNAALDNQLASLQKQIETRRDQAANQNGLVATMRHEIFELEKSLSQKKQADSAATLRAAVKQKQQELNELKSGLTRMQRLIAEKTAAMYVGL